MEKDDNLWASSRKKASEYISTDDVVRTIQKQCHYIEEAVSGINVKFSPLKKGGAYISAAILAFGERSGQITSKVFKPGKQDDIDESLKDVNTKFAPKYYGFTVYTDIYRFQVFTMAIKEYYPLYVNIDEDIFVEIQDELSTGYFDIDVSGYTIENPNQLKSFLSSIFSSKKFTAVIRTLQSEK